MALDGVRRILGTNALVGNRRVGRGAREEMVWECWCGREEVRGTEEGG